MDQKERQRLRLQARRDQLTAKVRDTKQDMVGLIGNLEQCDAELMRELREVSVPDFWEAYNRGLEVFENDGICQRLFALGAQISIANRLQQCIDTDDSLHQPHD